MTEPLPFVTEAERKTLRRNMRRARRRLTPGERRLAAQRLARNLRGSDALRNATRIGVYRPHGGELDVLSGFRHGLLRGKQLYLPALDPLRHGLLRFVRWDRDTRLVTNRFGIAEPCLRRNHFSETWSLDLVLMPLVAFDEAGNRLGMGGGFYDRTLEALWRHPRRPRLVGVAYEFQRVASLPAAPWDVPLDGVITDGRATTRLRR